MRFPILADHDETKRIGTADMIDAGLLFQLLDGHEMGIADILDMRFHQLNVLQTIQCHSDKTTKIKTFIVSAFVQSRGDLLTMDEINKKALRERLAHFKNDKEKTARSLGIARSTVFNWIKNYNLQPTKEHRKCKNN